MCYKYLKEEQAELYICSEPMPFITGDMGFFAG